MKKNIPVIVLGTLALLTACNGTSVSSSDPAVSSYEPVSQSPVSSENPKVCENDDKVHLIILTGQSGARGKALNADLTDEQKEENLDVDICAAGLTMPELSNIPEELPSSATLKVLGPGFGDSSAEFGPELGMGETLASRYPKDGDSRKSVIIKYTACGSTFTDHWYSASMLDDEVLSEKLNLTQIRVNEKTEEVTGPLTNNLYQLIDSTIAQLEGEGYETVIDGAVFLHGEQDAKYDDNMAIYEDALKYFIQDLRTYVGDADMPFVITEALTNSAKYSNELRSIQKRVAESVANTTLISATDLYTNTFEPWHFGAESNFVLGNRISAELISAANDTRRVVSFEDTVINAPLGADIVLPKYINATFDNGYSGLIKIEYTSSYDKNAAGDQKVSFRAETECGTYPGEMTVHVSDEPHVDGILNEYSSAKKNVASGIGDIYVHKGETGFYVSARIDDDDLWTDGEAWQIGDMGQKDTNDDFRVFIATDDASERYTACLSAANLLRVYDAGTSLSDSGLPSHNMLYKKFLTDYRYHVTTEGLANVEEGGQSGGMALELFLSYDDLGIDDPDAIKLCFDYNNVTMASGSRTNQDHYYAATAADHPETDIGNYFSINDLI